MTDLQVGEIVGNGGCIVEYKTTVHLKPVCGDFSPHGKYSPLFRFAG